jgi:gliding motility-associated-like protein
MVKRYIILLWGLVASALYAQDVVPDWYPKVDDAMGVFVNHDGEEEEIEVGETYDAPLTVTFMACPTDTMDFEVLYEWKIEQERDGASKQLALRPEENTTFTFTEGGTDVTYRVSLVISYHDRATGEVSGECEAEPITFMLRGSSLQIFNAFSPNGDGTNDVYRVKTQSLLSFRMKIFNRWGQEIVSGDQNSLTTEHEDGFTYYVCWDGMYHGSYVEDGVYFILVEAEGSDGIKYVKRGDINVLTRLRKEEKK